MFRRAAGVAVALTTYLVTASVALAQESTESGYGGEGVLGQPGGAGVGAETGAGALPFTGLDIALLLLAGAVLVAVGFTMRRLGKART